MNSQYLSGASPEIARILAILLVSVLLGGLPAEARDQWQIERPEPPPTSLESFSQMYGGGKLGHPAASMGNVPGSPGAGTTNAYAQGLSPSFWKGVSANRLPVGTILSGVVDTNVSSKKSERGDIFSIVLEDGYINNGQMIVPPGSRILCTVVGTFSAAYQRMGMPGRVTIALQTLVFPDGRSTQFFGLIDHNPAHDQLSEPKTKFGGFGLADYGQSLKGMVGSFGSGVGWVQNRRLRGKEFLIEAGQRVAVRVNRTMDLSGMIASAPGPGGQAAPVTVPGLAAPQADPVMAVPGIANTGMAPGMTPGLAPGMTPGMTSDLTQGIAPGMRPGPAEPDPNKVFDPGNDPAAKIPDPF